MRRAAWDAEGRALTLVLYRGERHVTLRWRRVAAIGATRSARLGAASWLEEKLVDTTLGEVVEEADLRHVTEWLVGDAEAAAGLPARDLLSFVGGRFFRVFVAALAREATEEPGGP